MGSTRDRGKQSTRAYTAGEGSTKERLYRADMCLVEWRKLASRQNRGIQKRPGS
jgi:hypothetical protein